MATINTNAGAMVALQNLNQTNKDLEQVQSRINTGPVSYTHLRAHETGA